MTPEPIDTVDLIESRGRPSKQERRQPYGLPTPPSSLPGKIQQVAEDIINNGQHKSTSSSITRSAPSAEYPREQVPLNRIESYKTLQDFNSLFDKIERTSDVGALFIEAYAEKLRDDMCKNCWLKHNINLNPF
jgi:hypothetical protein